MQLVRRRPLLRAAAIGGGAYYAGKRRQEAQERELGQEQRIETLEAQQAGAPPPVAGTGGGLSPDAIQRLGELAKLHDQGALTDEEFATQKERMLGS
jgi:hypothetical protein